MKRYRTRLLKIAAIILAIALASLIFPPYRDYCNANDANKYYCSVYEIFATLFAFVELHNGAFTVIATIAIAWFTLSLRESTDKLGEIANTTAVAQERDTKILQRAYLAVEPQGIRPKESNKQILLAYVGITNTGHLPARKVRSHITFAPATGVDLKDFPIHETEGANVVAPGITMRKNSIKTLPVSELEKLSKSGSLFFYVWGIVYYHDGFVDGRQIRFCHRYAWESFRDLPGGAGMTASAIEARYHEYGNGTDEDVVETLKGASSS
jgi:hypothetical protein